MDRERGPTGSWRREPDMANAGRRRQAADTPAQPNGANFNASASAVVPSLYMPWEGAFMNQVGQSGNNFFFADQQQPMQQQVHHGGQWPRTPNFGNHQRPQGQGTNLPHGKQDPSNKYNQRERDPIVPPSAASGGVPEPTPAYLLRASFLPRELPAPQPLLVIIDLNGTVLYRPSRKNPSKFVSRPFSHQFLSYCISTFHVMIWSSARPANVAALCDGLLQPGQVAGLVAVWGRDRFGLTAADYKTRVQCYKRLSRAWADPEVAATYPSDYDDAGVKIDAAAGAEGRRRQPGSWNQGNTVIIDDSSEKVRSEPYNAIQIPEFLGAEDDSILPQVHNYLNTLAYQADVSTYIRTNPFKPAENQ